MARAERALLPALLQHAGAALCMHQGPRTSGMPCPPLLHPACLFTPLQRGVGSTDAIAAVLKKEVDEARDKQKRKEALEKR